jgi:hypothetical protein
MTSGCGRTRRRDEVGDVVGDELGDVGDLGYALRRVRKYGWLRSLYNVFQFHKGERWRTFRRCSAEHANDMEVAGEHRSPGDAGAGPSPRLTDRWLDSDVA